MDDQEPDCHPLHQVLDLAREAVAAAVEGRPAPRPYLPADPGTALSADAFVTLTLAGSLRGCMGTLGAGLPAGVAVVRAAGMAATRDPRFRPVSCAELPGLRLEVSLLGPPHRLVDPDAFVAGRDGIIVEAQGRRALLLPQVATEMGWGTTEMLEAACEKAGLPVRAWRDPMTRLSVFEVSRIAGPAVVPTAAVAAT